jgi:hypothetical protein
MRAENGELAKLYDGFRADSVRWLWDSAADLEASAQERIQDLLADEGGTNEIVKNKALAFLFYQQQLHDVLYREMKKTLREAGRWNDDYDAFLDELKQLSLQRKQNFLQTDKVFDTIVRFDYDRASEEKFRVDPRAMSIASPKAVRVRHTDEQKRAIESYVQQYGQAVEGMGRIMMRAPIRQLFRTVEPST